MKSAVGAILYFVPYLFGVQANAQFKPISDFLVTSSNPTWAIGIGYVTVALFAIMGAIAAGYTLMTGGRAEVQDTAAPSN